MTSANPAANNRRPKLRGFTERIYQSLAVLEVRAHIANAAAAVGFAESFLAEQQKYAMFREFFPDEWQRSESSFYRRGPYVHYSERINEFFTLVNERLFPLFTGWNDDPETDFEEFGITPMNIDLCCDEFELGDLCVSYAAGLTVFSGDESALGFFSTEHNVRTDKLPEINSFPFDGIWTNEKEGRAGLYLTLFELIDHSTGNPWLDLTNCQSYTLFKWNRETLESLAENYRAAHKMLETTDTLDRLILSAPDETLREMIEFWNAGTVPSD